MDEMVAFSLMYGGEGGGEDDIDLDEILQESYLASVQHRNSSSSSSSATTAAAADDVPKRESANTAETQMQRDVQMKLFNLMSAGTGSTLKSNSGSTKAPSTSTTAKISG